MALNKGLLCVIVMFLMCDSVFCGVSSSQFVTQQRYEDIGSQSFLEFISDHDTHDTFLCGITLMLCKVTLISSALGFARNLYFAIQSVKQGDTMALAQSESLITEGYHILIITIAYVLLCFVCFNRQVTDGCSEYSLKVVSWGVYPIIALFLIAIAQSLNSYLKKVFQATIALRDTQSPSFSSSSNSSTDAGIQKVMFSHVNSQSSQLEEPFKILGKDVDEKAQAKNKAPERESDKQEKLQVRAIADIIIQNRHEEELELQKQRLSRQETQSKVLDNLLSQSTFKKAFGHSALFVLVAVLFFGWIVFMGTVCTLDLNPEK